MDKCIDESLCHSSFGKIRLVYPILCFFDKAELEAWMKNVRVASQAELDQQAQKYIINRSKR